MRPRGRRGVTAARAPHVDAGEQEQPHDVDEVPVPGGELEPEMLGRREVAAQRTQQADDEENGADDHVRAVKTRRHEEGRAVDMPAEAEMGVAVLVTLYGGEREAEQDGEDQAPFQA